MTGVEEANRGATGGLTLAKTDVEKGDRSAGAARLLQPARKGTTLSCMLELANRFRSTWERATRPAVDADSGPVWESLSAHYDEPHRHYHNFDHIRHCLGQLDEVSPALGFPDAIELAIWFHDIIYKIGAVDNEARSAELFRILAQPVMDEAVIDRVTGLIMATAHADVALNGDEAVMVDIDLSSFGLPWEEYLQDSNALREEQGHIPDAQFYAGKQRFLEHLAARESIFQTPYFREKLESRARANIARYLDSVVLTAVS